MRDSSSPHGGGSGGPCAPAAAAVRLMAPADPCLDCARGTCKEGLGPHGAPLTLHDPIMAALGLWAAMRTEPRPDEDAPTPTP